MSLLLLGAATAPAGAAPAPGRVLRDYLPARLQGDLEQARSLWEPRDLRRAGALGIDFTGLEASYDDYWMLTAAERQALAAQVTPVVRDSVVEAESARFTVLLREQSGAVRDTLSYMVQQSDGAWRVSLPWAAVTRDWTRRESRFVRLRGKRLVMVSQIALTAVDKEIQRIFEQLGAAQTAPLRLERIKLEYYLCETDDEVRALVGSLAHAGYLPAGGRVVARVLPDMSHVVPVLLHLTLQKTPLENAPLFDAGLAAALGGSADLGAQVYVQRARNMCARDPARLGAPFDPAVSRGEALPVEALWSRVLLEKLGPEKFIELVRATAAAVMQSGDVSNAAALGPIEAATGQKGAALQRLVQQGAGALASTIRPGCAPWPADIDGLQPFLRWRDGEDAWGLLGYEVGDDYVITVAPYDRGLPKWMRQMVDSLASEYAGAALEMNAEEVVRPSGDPPPLIFLVRVKLEQDLEPYESPLFAEHFMSRAYKNDLYGLFVTPDDARLYDYAQNKLIAEYDLKTAPPGGSTFYDEAPGHICFSFPKEIIPRPLTAYYVALMVYTGE